MSEAALATTLRRHRRAAGLSQERLAERSGVSVRTIRNIESGRVKLPRLASARALADALGIDGPERTRFNQLCAGDEPEAGVAGVAGVASEPGRNGRLPVPLTPLVGRAWEVAALTRVLSGGSASLVTLTGVAGVGKSRLAIEVVRSIQDRDPGRRAWWVPLASIGDVRYVLDAVARAVDCPTVSMAAIAARLGGDAPLLALDNLEHLDGIGELVIELLTAVPSLTVLATSRAPVGARGEHEWPVQPLPVPSEDAADPAALASVGSVQLLVERVRAVVPGFELTAANGPAVAEICRLLDGLPLAMELAARQWRVRGGAGLVRSIRRDPLGLHDIGDSGPSEHASLLNALDASYALLDDSVRYTLGCLSVFPAGWTVDAAVAVADSPASVDHLDRLVALGLLVRSVEDGAAEPRFSMLPTIRAFASGKAREAGIAEAAQARHAAYFHRSVGGVIPEDEEPGVPLEAERDNIRAALGWFRDHDPLAGLEMALALYPRWYGQGRETEGLGHFEELFVGVGEVPAGSSGLAAKAQQRAANLAYTTGEYELAARLAAKARTGYQDRGDARGSVEALGTLGMATLAIDPQMAVVHCRAAATEAERLGDPALHAWLLDRLGLVLTQLGRLDEATVTIERALDIAAEHHLAKRRIGATLDLEFLLMMQGRWEAADQVLETGAPLVAAADEARHEAFWFGHWAAVRANLGDPDGASALVELVAERAATTGSAVIGTIADFALGEVKLAIGARGEALAAFRRAGSGRAVFALPLNRLIWLANVALAASDVATAACAAGCAEELAARYGIEIPALALGRLDAARDRWVTAVGDHVWTEQVAASAGRPLEDLYRELAEPPAGLGTR